MDRILIIDTATPNLVVGVIYGKKQKIIVKNIVSGASEHIYNMINNVLKKAKSTISQINTICVNVGPGSFTGIRIGVVAAKALAEVCGAKVGVVNTFDIISYKNSGTAVLFSNKDKFYNSQTEFCSATELEALKQPLLTFNMPAKQKNTVSFKTYLKNFIALSKTCKFVDVVALAPYYAKLSQAEENAKVQN